MKRLAILLALIIFPFTGAAFGQTAATQPTALDPGLAPFVTNGTLLVAQADPTKIDVLALQQWIGAGTSDPKAAASVAALLEQTRPMAKQWLADFHKAGGSGVFAVAFMGDPSDIPAVLIVPLADGSDAKAISSLLVNGKTGGADHFALANDPQAGLEAIVLHNAVVFGLTPQVEKMKVAKQVDRPLFAAGLEHLGDAPLKIVFSPSVALQLIGSTMFPDNLPDAVGGGSPAILINSLSWAGLAITPPAHEDIRLEIQCKNEAGAAAYANAADALLNTFANDAATDKTIPHKDELVAALKPTIQGNLVSIDLNGAALDNLIRPSLIAYLDQGRKRSVHEQSISNEKMLMMGVIEYAQEHEGAFPPKLDDIATYLGGPANLKMAMKDPIDPANPAGFVYVKPAAKFGLIADPTDTVVIYEATHTPDDMVAAGFADAHADLMTRADLTAALRVQHAPLPAAQP
jgi:hypothetical protein